MLNCGVGGGGGPSEMQVGDDDDARIGCGLFGGLFDLSSSDATSNDELRLGGEVKVVVSSSSRPTMSSSSSSSSSLLSMLLDWLVLRAFAHVFCKELSLLEHIKKDLGLSYVKIVT